MRVAGMISFVLVLIAAAFGIYSLSEAFGYKTSELFGLLWPVAVGVTVLAVVLLAFGRWSATMLNRDEGSGHKPEREETKR